MTDPLLEDLKPEVLSDEGFRDDDGDGLYEIYIDTEGYKTCGIGHRVRVSDLEWQMDEGEEISYERVIELFERDLHFAIQDSRLFFPGFADFPHEVQLIIANMMFNLGRPRFSGFKKMIVAVTEHDWLEAAVEMEDSRWARDQVPNRAGRLIERMKSVV